MQYSNTESPAPSPSEVLDFLRLVWAVDSALDCVTDEMASAGRDLIHGISGLERLVLRVLTEYPAMCASELASILGMSRGSLVQPIKDLEAAGYVERTAHPEDRRRTVLQLTRRGAKVSEAVASAVEGAVRRVLTQATGRTVDSAKLILGALANELSPDALRQRKA